MIGWKTNVLLGALASTALLVGCDSSVSAPDVDGMVSSTNSAGATGALTTGESRNNRGDGALGVVFVTSQGLYYDTFVTAERLPPHGPFQLLKDGVTKYGPGDKQYVGGRWKVPDGNGGYDYFLCPLLGPGREEP